MEELDELTCTNDLRNDDVELMVTVCIKPR